MARIRVKFLASWDKYMKNEVAGFDEALAEKLIAKKVAVRDGDGTPGKAATVAATDDSAQRMAALDAREAALAEREAALAKAEETAKTSKASATKDTATKAETTKTETAKAAGEPPAQGKS